MKESFGEIFRWSFKNVFTAKFANDFSNTSCIIHVYMTIDNKITVASFSGLYSLLKKASCSEYNIAFIWKTRTVLRLKLWPRWKPFDGGSNSFITSMWIPSYALVVITFSFNLSIFEFLFNSKICYICLK